MKNGGDRNGSYRKGLVGAWAGILGNLFLSLIKFLFGIFGHSAAMVADAVHSLSDLLSSAVVLAGLKMARRLPDREHPYGHSKAESVSAQVVSVFLIFLGGMVFLNSLRRLALADYQIPSFSVLIVALVSIVSKEGLYQYKNRLGKRIHSSSLVADAWHHRSDAFSSVAVLIGVFLARVGGPAFHLADHVAAMVVALIICCTGLKLLKRTSSELMDLVVKGEEADLIRKSAEAVNGVEAVEKLLVRKSGMELFADIHVEVDPGLSVVEGHDIARRVKAELLKKVPPLRDVLVHVEPYLPDKAHLPPR